MKLENFSLLYPDGKTQNDHLAGVNVPDIDMYTLQELGMLESFNPKSTPAAEHFTTDPAVITYRNQPFSDLLNNPSLLATLHRRYTRQPGLEDPRQGTGLGLVLARCAAIAHGGTLLLAPDSRGGTRYCPTLQLNDQDDGVLRDHIQMDYAGNYDHILVELSDVLPSRLYGPKQVND